MWFLEREMCGHCLQGGKSAWVSAECVLCASGTASPAGCEQLWPYPRSARTRLGTGEAMQSLKTEF